MIRETCKTIAIHDKLLEKTLPKLFFQKKGDSGDKNTVNKMLGALTDIAGNLTIATAQLVDSTSKKNSCNEEPESSISKNKKNAVEGEFNELDEEVKDKIRTACSKLYKANGTKIPENEWIHNIDTCVNGNTTTNNDDISLTPGLVLWTRFHRTEAAERSANFYQAVVRKKGNIQE